MKIGFIGLGMMGSPMCVNLIQKRTEPVMVYDINPAAVREVVEKGAQEAADTYRIGRECEIIFTMLPKNEHVKAVYDILFSLESNGRIYVDMSTISPAVSREIAVCAEKRGEKFLDAPVVKSREAAEKGTLGIYVGGDRTVCEQIRPFLACMGSSVLYLGENGAGLVMKLCHNMLVGQIQNGVNEMLTLARKAGEIDCDTFVKAIACGGGKNFYLESKAEKLGQQDYSPAFAVEYMHKDVHLAEQLSEQYGLSLDGISLIVKRYDKAMEMGLGKDDFCSTIRLFEEQTGKRDEK